MRKRITTSIEKNALNELDIKIIHSDFFKDRSGYLEFLIKLIPFIPNDIMPGADIKETIRKMYVNSGAETDILEPAQQTSEGAVQKPDDADQQIVKMIKSFKLRTTTKGSPTT